MAKELKTKDRVLQLLESRNGTFVSGQEIADTLYITRAGIWKAVKSLRESGVEIEAVSNRGYRLVREKDILSKEYIENVILYDECKDDDIRDTDEALTVIVKEEVESTNDLAKQLSTDTEQDMVIISDYQTDGHGRRGRSFFSPKGTGLYMSFLIHPKVEISKATMITCMGAVAVCKAIEQMTEAKPSIKWVNDIFLEDRKICGILTEGHTSMEDGSLEYVVVGIGINLYYPRDGFPEEIKKIAGVLFPNGQNRENVKNELCCKIIHEFMKLYRNMDNEEFIDDYRSRSNLIGSYVKIIQPGKNIANEYGKVLGIDNECHLVVETDNGETKALSTGEVSVVKY